MKIQTTRPFDKDYNALPDTVKERANKQFFLLLENPDHPFLRLKKIKGHPSIWEERITKSYRFTFQISGGCLLAKKNRDSRHPQDPIIRLRVVGFEPACR
jgi:mRNA-degrading endonuclease RelE of RelBE toxin-antitoxin system